MRKVLILCACGIAFLGAACEPYNPQSPSKEERTMESCSEAVAKVIGIAWTAEDGATEKLDTFNRKVKECMKS